MGNLKLNLWRCASYDLVMKKHFHHILKETIFKDVEALIYVFDVNTKSVDLDDDLSVY